MESILNINTAMWFEQDLDSIDFFQSHLGFFGVCSIDPNENRHQFALSPRIWVSDDVMASGREDIAYPQMERR